MARGEELKDPEVDSDFARQKALSKERGTPPGIDPETGERAAITYRQLYNETNGDEARAKEIFHAVAKAGGYGDVDLNQSLDIRSATRSVKENKVLADQAEDLFARNHFKQSAQTQDNIVNEISEALRKLERG